MSRFFMKKYFYDLIEGRYVAESELYQMWREDNTDLDYPYWLEYQPVEYIGNYKDVLYDRYL